MKIEKLGIGEYKITGDFLNGAYVIDFDNLKIKKRQGATCAFSTCSCGRGIKVEGEYYCRECLRKNPLLCR